MDNLTKSVRSKAQDKAGAYLKRCGYKKGGAVKKAVKKSVHEHEKSEHGGKLTKLKLKSGGKVDGKKSSKRLDKFKRGGAIKKHHGTKVNVIVAPQGGGQQGPDPKMAFQAGLAAGAKAGGGSPPPAGPAPGMMPPPGAMAPPMKPPGMKRGGMVHMTAGALSGEGRLEKTAIQKKDRKNNYKDL